MNRIEALHHLNESEDLVIKSLEEVESIALDSTIKYDRKEWIIDKVEELEPNKFTFWLKQTKGRKDSDKRAIGTETIHSGRATTDNEALVLLCNELHKNTEVENKEKEEKRLQSIKDRETKDKIDTQNKIEKTIKLAQDDFAKGNRDTYKLLKSKKTSKETDLFNLFYDINLYLSVFEKAEEKKKADDLIKNRITNVLYDYPGDLNQLLDWIKENVTGVTIRANAKAAEREQKALDELNFRLGTDYQVEVTEDIYPVYSIRFKNSDTAPEEFKKWIVKKHSNETSDPTVWKDAPAMSKGVLKSNSIVKDLLFNQDYKFKFLKK